VERKLAGKVKKSKKSMATKSTDKVTSVLKQKNGGSLNVCQIKCKNAKDLANHVKLSHCKDELKAELPIKKVKLEKRTRKKVPKQVQDDGSDTDEGYMKKQKITITIKRPKKPGAPKRVKPEASDDIDDDDDDDLDNQEDTEKKPKRQMEDESYRPDNGAVKCKECGKIYQSKRALRRHFSVTHGVEEHICEICGHSFKAKESLYHHKRGVHDNLKSYKCPIEGCDASFNFSHSLRLHRLKHSGARPHMCNVCGKTYLTAYHLKVHMQATHSDSKNFACKICDKRFSYTTSLKMHEATHNKVERVKCESCEKTFLTQQALKYHVMSKHTEPGHFPCDECGKVCKNKHQLQSHKKRHTVGSARFMCDMCGKRFVYKSALDMHKAIHKDEKSFTCKICDKSFKTYPTLYSHQYVHRVDSPFSCSTCNKSFKTKERLKAHERRHSGLKPHKCMMCDHCFPDKGGLSKHLRTVHCKVKKFVCDICGKSTARADNLRVHMKVHMKGTDYKPKEKVSKEKAQRQEPKHLGLNLPSTVLLAFDSGSKKERHGEFFDDQSEDSHSNTGVNYVTNGFDQNVPHYSTVDANQIASTADQNMPLNLHQNDSSNSQAGSAYITLPNVVDERSNRVNPQPSVSTSGAPNHLMPPLQHSPYIYPWPYPYPPNIQSQSGATPSYFQQQQGP